MRRKVRHPHHAPQAREREAPAHPVLRVQAVRGKVPDLRCAALSPAEGGEEDGDRSY